MKPTGTILNRLAALSRRRRACSRDCSSSKATWLKRARALRTWAASWIGSRRRPLRVDVGERPVGEVGPLPRVEAHHDCDGSNRV